MRSRRAHDLDEALYQFYAARLHPVSSVHDLNKQVRVRIMPEPDFLCATEADLVGEDDTTYDRSLFPDQVSVGRTVLPLSYSYQPGEEQDGVTVRVPLPVAGQLTSGQLQWMIPGLREEQIGALLRALPKALRRPLMPLEPKIAEIARAFAPGTADFLTALAAHLARTYGVPVRAADWPPGSLPAHLQARVEIVDGKNQTVAAGRDLQALRTQVEGSDLRSEAWERAARKWERAGVTAWSFGDLPETVVVEEVGGAPLHAWPGLELKSGAVSVRLFRKRAQAEHASPPAVRQLAELALAKELTHLRKELARQLTAVPVKKAAGFQSALQQLAAPAPAAFSAETLPATAAEHLLRHLLVLAPVLPLSAARFEQLVSSARRELPQRTYDLAALVKQILQLRGELLARPKGYPALRQDLERLVPADFLARTPAGPLAHLPRYLKAIGIRAERAWLNPAKDAERVKLLQPLLTLEKEVPAAQREAFRWMLEEYRVSLFAQELGTPAPVSPQRLRALAGLQ